MLLTADEDDDDSGSDVSDFEYDDFEAVRELGHVQ